MHNLSLDVHGFCCICRFSRLGQPFSAVWVTKMQSWVDAWERSLRIVRSHGTFQIQRLRRKALPVGRHVVSGMLWMSLSSARWQDGAASVTITDTTTRSVQ